MIWLVKYPRCDVSSQERFDRDLLIQWKSDIFTLNIAISQCSFSTETLHCYLMIWCVCTYMCVLLCGVSSFLELEVEHPASEGQRFCNERGWTHLLSCVTLTTSVSGTVLLLVENDGLLRNICCCYCSFYAYVVLSQTLCFCCHITLGMKILVSMRQPNKLSLACMVW